MVVKFYRELDEASYTSINAAGDYSLNLEYRVGPARVLFRDILINLCRLMWGIIFQSRLICSTLRCLAALSVADKNPFGYHS